MHICSHFLPRWSSHIAYHGYDAVDDHLDQIHKASLQDHILGQESHNIAYRGYDAVDDHLDQIHKASLQDHILGQESHNLDRTVNHTLKPSWELGTRRHWRKPWYTDSRGLELKEITHVIPDINIIQVPRKLFEHLAVRPSVQTSSEGPSKC